MCTVSFVRWRRRWRWWASAGRLLVVRELLCGNYRFGEILHGVPLMSRSLLSQRLKTLEDAGLVERRERAAGNGHEYHLTPAGESCGRSCSGWGRGDSAGCGASPSDQLDPVLLMWDLRRNLDPQRLPERTHRRDVLVSRPAGKEEPLLAARSSARRSSCA